VLPLPQRGADAAEVAFVEFVQWNDDRQLAACKAHAHRIGMKVGLYLDVAVGVQSRWLRWPGRAGRDLAPARRGAPPDPLNTAGRIGGWPALQAAVRNTLVRAYRESCAPRCAMKAQSGSIMCWDGSALSGPRGFGPENGAYVKMPFEGVGGDREGRASRNAAS